MEEDHHHDQVSSLQNEENNFMVVDKKEVGGGESEDANKVSSTSGQTGEEPDGESYLAPYPSDVNSKLIELEEHDDISRSTGSSTGAFNAQQPDSNTIQPDWGPFNLNNSTLGYLQPEKQETNSSAEVESVLKEFAPASTTTNTIDTSLTSDPASKPPTHDNSVGDSACATWFCNVDPRVLDLIYWRNPKKTGMVFGAMVFVLLSVSCFSLLSVVSYLSLGLLALTLSFRAYKSVLQAVQKTGDQHPFKEYLELDVDYSREAVDTAVSIVEKRLNGTVKELRRLFLIEDTVDSLKFFLLLWVFTYIGAWFNGLTLVTLAVVAIFSLPKLYETYQVPIDNYVDLGRTQVCNIITQVQDKVPFLKKKPKTQ